MDVLSAFPENASSREEYLIRQAEFVPPPDPTYDNRPDLNIIEAADINREPWQLKAMCKGQPRLMQDQQEGEFDDEYRRRVVEAKKFCGGCAVRAECLEHALIHREVSGIWGGKTALERKRILKTQKAS